MSLVLTALPPLVSDRTRVLILGSFPGAASLAAQQYYGHPQNQFWRIFNAVWPSAPMNTCIDSYQNNSDCLLERHLGLWDVYAACEREGSLDSRIKSPVLNDFTGLKLRCPGLQAIVHNGAESFRHAGRLDFLGVPTYKLPSTSPAHASLGFKQKLAAWRAVFEQHGLVPTDAGRQGTDQGTD